MDNFSSVVPAPDPIPIEGTPLPPEKQRNPGLAFVISLFIPGAGQMYCGKRRGLWTMLFFFLAGAGFVYAGPLPGEGRELVWRLSLRIGIALYGFAFLDAYFTAKEVNAGVSDIVDNANPRVAAILNLTTNGFGYFYLGEQKLGIIVFVLLRVLNSAAMQMQGSDRTPVLLILELISVGMALHAWHKAKKQISPLLPPQGSAGTGAGLPTMVPAALAILVAINYAMFVVGGSMLPDYSKVDQSKATIRDNADGSSVYENPTYGVKFLVPAEWKLNNKSDASAFAQAERDAGACNVQLMATSVLDHSVASSQELYSVIKQKYPQARLASTKEIFLSGIRGEETQIQIPIKVGEDEIEMQQRWTILRRGLSRYVLISTFSSFDAACLSEVEQIRDTVEIR
jgi:hypothetical protein